MSNDQFSESVFSEVLTQLECEAQDWVPTEDEVAQELANFDKEYPNIAQAIEDYSWIQYRDKERTIDRNCKGAIALTAVGAVAVAATPFVGIPAATIMALSSLIGGFGQLINECYRD